MSLKLLGTPISPYFRKVRVVLEEKSIPYETEELVAAPKTPELLAMNPLGKIPIVIDGENIIPDSSVICAYLERIYPGSSLYPEEAGAYARALFLEEYSDTRLCETINAISFERFVKPNFLQQETDEPRVKAMLKGELPSALSYIESQLDDRPMPFEHFTVADAAIGSALAGLSPAQISIDADTYPRTARYAETLLARPSFQRALEQN